MSKRKLWVELMTMKEVELGHVQAVCHVMIHALGKRVAKKKPIWLTAPATQHDFEDSNV